MGVAGALTCLVAALAAIGGPLGFLPASGPPSGPAIQWTSSPAAQDPGYHAVVNVTFNSTYTPGPYGSSIAIFSVELYYAELQADLPSPPTDCSSEWISTGCQGGQNLGATPTGVDDWSATTSFAVNPPSRDTEVVVRATALTNEAQASDSTHETIHLNVSSTPGSGAGDRGNVTPTGGVGQGDSGPPAASIDGLVIAIAIIALVLGASAVMALVVKRRQ